MQSLAKNSLFIRTILLIFIATKIHTEESFEKWIVVTTINYPTKQLMQYAKLPGWHLVVVGDKKTPSDWHLDDCEYLDIEKQLSLKYRIIKYLPWNHYSRKNIRILICHTTRRSNNL